MGNTASVCCRYVLPFSEVVVWRSSALAVDERHLLDLPYLLRAVPSSHLLAARMQTKLLWDSYFKSVETVVMTTLKVTLFEVKRIEIQC